MNTERHLELILDYCNDCLAIASKRTPGVWSWQANGKSGPLPRRYNLNAYTGSGLAETVFKSEDEVWPKSPNAAFITRCPGAAEAGWKATVAAVTAILSSSQVTEHWLSILKPMRDDILEAYPLTLIAP